MKIRDAHATINGDKTEYEMPSGGLQVIGEDGQSLFSISVHTDGTLEVTAGGCCKQDGVVLDDRIAVLPWAANRILVKRVVAAQQP